MRTTKAERVRAEQISAVVDQLIHDPEAQPKPFDAADAGVLATAQKLARLPSMLGPVDPALEQRVMSRIRGSVGSVRRVPRLRPGWAVAGVVAVLLVAMLLTPLGQTAVASFLTVFNLGRTEVRITPANTPPATVAAHDAAIRQGITLEEAQAQVSFTIPQPAYLPSGFHLVGVSSFTYPDLPAWVPQPFSLELAYGADSGQECTLRLYPISLGERASISGMNLEAAPIQDMQDVDVNGQPGVLLRLGAKGAEAAWQEVVWEQDDLILALFAPDLSEAELLRIARSVR